MRRALYLAVALALVLAPSAVRADVWDVQTQNDNAVGTTENELVHGSDQLHDLGALAGPLADHDWFRMSLKPFSSYEVAVDATSGDVGGAAAAALLLEQTSSAGANIATSQAVSANNFARSLRMRNTTGTAIDNNYLHVKSGSCTTACTSNDVYRIRFYETTYAIPRFNNSGTQMTVLMLQNPTDYLVEGTIYFWDAAGNQLGNSAFSLTGKKTLVLPTANVSGVAGKSGAITVAHNGRYGDLAGKTVALEPSTGFSFDSPMVSRPH